MFFPPSSIRVSEGGFFYLQIIVTMEIIVRRIARKEAYTIGRMFINGHYFCDTLEDKDRGLSDSMGEEEVRKIKIYGKTAIPCGRYSVGITYWQKIRGYVPYLSKVKGFTGIFIHAGATADNTLGCILVGKNTIVGRLTDSASYSRKLTTMIREALKNGERVSIAIE